LQEVLYNKSAKMWFNVRSVLYFPPEMYTLQ